MKYKAKQENVEKLKAYLNKKYGNKKDKCVTTKGSQSRTDR
jgi:hypothetical protein